MKEQIEEMVKVMNECCNRYDEQGNHIGNKCYECEEWSDDNHCCCSYNTKEATALYNAGYRKQEWISVDDRLPEEREHVIVFCEDGLVCEAWHKKEGLFWWMDDRDGIAAATHWMPLPEPPKMKGGE